MTLDEVDPGAITALTAYRGRNAALSAGLETAHGLGLPAPGTSTKSASGTRALWAGLNRAFLVGEPAAPSLDQHASVVDQSDAWAVAALTGTGATDVLARLCPVDLSRASFAEGAVARTLLGHMTALVTRTGPDGFEIFVFRSMAASACHDLTEAMRSVAARARLAAD